MKRIFQRIDRIRASGTATLELQESSAFYPLSGRKFKVHSMGEPALKCRVTLIIDDKHVDFTINDVY